MMTKIRSIQDSWLAKSILILTALSFMSLFGVSGYLSSAAGNRPIIRVDDIVVYQDEINNQYNQELQMAKSLFGDSLDISDTMKNAIMQSIVQKDLVNAVLQKTAEDLDVSISNDLIRKIIYSQPEFSDASGNFSLDKFRRLLSASGWSEQKYIETLRQDIIKQHLIQNPTEGINIPDFMTKYLAQLENQRKVFQYITIKPSALKIDRTISDEELEQYYQDFAVEFEEPENRNVSFIDLPVDKLASAVVPGEDEIKAYYQDNISQFVIPEQRRVLQMVFDNQEDAQKAYQALQSGKDFYAAAKEFANQDKDDTELGEVSQDMLLADLSEPVFALAAGEYTEPVQSDLGWHIMKVVSVTPKKETKLSDARAKIIDAIRKDRAYEAAYETVARIEDKLGSGATLEEIADEQHVRIHKVVGLNEDGKAASVAPQFKDLAASTDFVDTAFSYNPGEISQVIETDNGFVFVRVDSIKDSHIKDISEVRGEIQKMWETNEKNAIAQEIINDVTHDIENGDSIASVASRFHLPLNTTRALKRNESFAGLNSLQMAELFQEKVGSPKLVNQDDTHLIIVPTKVLQAETTLSDNEKEVLRSKAQSEIGQTAADSLVDAYASNFKVRVKYKYVGLAD